MIIIISIVLLFVLIIQYTIWFSKVLSEQHESKLDFFTDLIPFVIYLKFCFYIADYIRNLK
jgi:phosphate starvation-inducible membrane PsiE